MMNKKTSLFFLLFSYIALATNTVANAENQQEVHKLIIEIDYGEGKPIRKVEVERDSNKSALEVLQAVAELKTMPAGPDNAIVIAIDGMEAIKGETAWYYTMDGENPGVLASSKLIGDAQSMRWHYKQDNCSKKVDK